MPVAASLANEGCIGCGQANPIGLHLQFEPHPDGGVQASFTPKPEHQGWDGIMHGGMVTLLLDEAMAWAAAEKTSPYYTARAEIKYRRPVFIGQPLLLRGWIVRDRGLRLETRAEVHSSEGQLLAEGTALFIRAGQPG
ncbi:MAG TPA: PaaI family thioesterase [Chloroflexota bacterium]|nr:PaaI family thioesterase [Chloroflexota bacterium]